MRIASSLFRAIGVAVMSTTVALTTVPANAATPKHATPVVTVAPHISRQAAHPDLSVGGSGPTNFYINFNHVDQLAIAAGAGAAIAAALCGLGPVVCVIAAAAVAIALVYVNEYGLCAHKGTLRAYVVNLRLTKIRCV